MVSPQQDDMVCPELLLQVHHFGHHSKTLRATVDIITQNNQAVIPEVNIHQVEQLGEFGEASMDITGHKGF